MQREWHAGGSGGGRKKMIAPDQQNDLSDSDAIVTQSLGQAKAGPTMYPALIAPLTVSRLTHAICSYYTISF